ncbi:GDSL esterase/lipase At4g10955 [Ricinus communis]|uniref:Triacylglycerol lipase, putative n=1 Tax=Ricinus communis TaxID=3988 RepID=B9RCU0_RICCO|nr:GDSL esterase/lipase At4g10955 [Ricinus communis]XP_015571497.1 GDSL esterase/lipase At4g10955 [Ricinus communis]XP_025015678.1 GDSL esterase/lipase At4g10955 [Ricinus communis]EEF51361.1 triacylglycerol lipase, putative [Ricinus communis]|eukprot:XP_002509974.1 GDSL esterase/lipase At4g10955 [Ricinus communis]
MASEREDFSLSGPLHLTAVDWTNAHHRRSIAASLVQGVYILERDRQLKRQGPEALANPWWEFFHFQLLRKLVDDVDSSIFGAIYEFKPPTTPYNYSLDQSPRYVIAFRGTVTKPDSLSRDLELDLHIIRNGLHETSRFEIAMQAVRNVVATVGESNVWLAGHSLGAAMALLAGKTMAKTSIFIQAFLFNSPFFSAPIERIKDKRVKHGLRIASSVITAGLAIAATAKKNYQNRQAVNLFNQQNHGSVDPFIAVSAWRPSLFVNLGDHICSEYVGYFEHRKKMDDIGIGAIERLATQNSISGLIMSAMGKQSESEPLHLLPSANLTVNLTPSQDFKEAHGIHQWWRPDLDVQSKLYKY